MDEVLFIILAWAFWMGLLALGVLWVVMGGSMWELAATWRVVWVTIAAGFGIVLLAIRARILGGRR